ncbi:MAG: N-acetylglucosamine-6-phosphate deacetylase [Clostridiaceae bacterium]
MKGIINGKLILPNGLIENKIILFEDKIIDIVDTIPSNIETIDAKGNFIAPGLIDIHIHGAGGCDTMDGTIDAINTISETIAKYGVTSFLPTTMTMSMDAIYNSLTSIRKIMNSPLNGAKVLGAHMEGPFINPKYKGAQNHLFIQNPDFKVIEAYKDIIKLITIAPEMDENNKFIKEVKLQSDIVISIGHSNATFEETIDAINNGATHITHTFNAMNPFTHRSPGIIGAAFSTDVSAEIIADKIHVHPKVFQIFLNNKGKSKVILITDSMRAGCMKEGQYELGGQPVYVKNGSATLEDGTLAGSVLTLNKAVKNFFDNTNLELHEAFALASYNPAQVLNIQDKKGSIEVGKDADLIIVDDNFNIHTTIVEGRLVYSI